MGYQLCVALKDKFRHSILQSQSSVRNVSLSPTKFNNAMISAELESIAHQWLDAFNDQNLEQLLVLYDDRAQHYSPKLRIQKPETNGVISGKDSLRAWWQDAFNRLPTLHYELIRLTPFDNRVFMEYVRHVKDEDDLYVGEMLEIEDGKIVASSVFHR